MGKIVNTPLMKFLSYTCSYLTFLVVIIVSKLYLRFAFNSFVCNEPPGYAYAFITVILMWIFGEYAPQCGAADAELTSHLVRTQSLNVFPFKAWRRSVYSNTSYAYCQEFLPRLFLPFHSIHLHFLKTFPDFFLRWLWLTPVAV